MRKILCLAALAASAFGAAPASAAALLKVGGAGAGITMKTENGVRVWRAAKSAQVDLAGAAPAARAPAPTLVVEIVAPARRHVSAQGFWTGAPEGSRRYVQGFYSGDPVRRGRTTVRIIRRAS